MFPFNCIREYSTYYNFMKCWLFSANFIENVDMVTQPPNGLSKKPIKNDQNNLKTDFHAALLFRLNSSSVIKLRLYC